MIGKPEWFTRRKYGGWGLFPVAWQGWVYIVLFVAAMFGTQYIPADQNVRVIALGIIGIILVVDTVDLMRRVQKDERDTLHEALAERNALWAVIFVLAAGVAYQAAQSAMRGDATTVDPVIIAALVIGLVVKATTNLYLDRKN